MGEVTFATPSISTLLGSDAYASADVDQRWTAIRGRIIKALALPHVPSDFIHTSRARSVCEGFMARDRSRNVRSVLLSINLERLHPDSYIDISVPKVACHFICDCEKDTAAMQDDLCKARGWSQKLQEVLLLSPPPPDAIQIVGASTDSLLGLRLAQPTRTLEKVRQDFDAEQYGISYLSVLEGTFVAVIENPDADADWSLISQDGRTGWVPTQFLQVVLYRY